MTKLTKKEYNACIGDKLKGHCEYLEARALKAENEFDKFKKEAKEGVEIKLTELEDVVWKCWEDCDTPDKFFKKIVKVIKHPT